VVERGDVLEALVVGGGRFPDREREHPGLGEGAAWTDGGRSEPATVAPVDAAAAASNRRRESPSDMGTCLSGLVDLGESHRLPPDGCEATRAGVDPGLFRHAEERAVPHAQPLFH
jgi:hypothetical protein